MSSIAARWFASQVVPDTIPGQPRKPDDFWVVIVILALLLAAEVYCGK